MASVQPLAGKRIVVTRAREQAGGISEKLRGLGADVVECPAISIAQLEDYSEMDRAIRGVDSYDWVIFTSVNGVEAFFGRAGEIGASTDALESKKLGAIGPATADALRVIGYTADFVPDNYVAEAIIEQIEDMEGCRVLLPRADIARKALGEGLRAKGATVDEITAYRTVPGDGSERLAQLLRDGEVDAVTFTSSSTVRYTVESLVALGVEEAEVVGLLNRTAVVCIGPITGATAEGYGLRIAKTAQEYTSDGLVNALVELFSL